MNEAESHDAALDLARSANGAGEQALAGDDLHAAGRAFTTALDHLRELRSDQRTGELAAIAHTGLGRVDIAANDIRAADLRFDQVQRLRPASPEGFYWAGCTAAHGANYPRAEWLLNATLDRDAGHGRAYLQRAYVRLRQRQPEPALTDLLAAAKHQADDDNARLLTAALLVRYEDAEQAAAIAAGFPDNAVAAAILGMARYRQGKVDAAAEEFERAIAAGCRDEAVLLHHGLACFERRDYTRCIAVWQAFPDLVATARYARAAERLAANDFSGAIDDLDGSGLSVEVSLHDAASAIAQGDWERARSRLRDGGQRGLRYLAVLDFRDGQHAAAEQQWQQGADPISRFGRAISALRNTKPADLELRDLCADREVPIRVQRLAGRVLAALRIRGGDWSAAMEALDSVEETDWPAVLAEGRYRTGRHDLLAAMPDNPWQGLAATGPARKPAAPGGRAGREHALRGWVDGLAAARQGDWPTAAAALHHDIDRLPVNLVLLKAVACVLSGLRADAAAHLAGAAARTPAECRISHAQMMLYLHTLCAADDQAPDPLGWRSCIGAWVSVLYDLTFWTYWREHAQRRYRCHVPVEAIRDARTALDEFVEQRVPSDDLVLLLRRERAAAALLEQVGGLPNTDPAGPPIVCGPLRIAELGLQHRLSGFLRGLPSTDGRSVQLFQQFSEIGVAMAQLAAGRPRAAAMAALDLRCPSCARTGGRIHPAMIPEPLLCEPECPEFDVRNPAFCTYDEKQDELAKVSAALAARTLLGIARGNITSAEMDLSETRTCWRAAVTLAMRFNRREAILREVADDALGRARTLSKRDDLTDAIAVLDAALAAIPPKDTTEHQRITTELSLLLRSRAIGRYEADEAGSEQALADLRRAVKLSPDLPRPRFGLGVLLREVSYQLFRKFEAAESIRLLSESVHQFDIGVTMHDTENFREELERTREELKRMLEDYGDQQSDAES